jgi:hypothetical protein
VNVPEADDEQPARRLSQALKMEADAIPVGIGWPSIQGRIMSPEGARRSFNPVTSRRRHRRAIGIGALCVSMAAALVAAVIIGGRRPPAANPPPPPPRLATTSVPRYDPTIPTMVVYRCNVEVIAARQPPGSILSITPERIRTDSRDVGVAAMNALIETKPLHPGNVPWNADQKIDVKSVTVGGGLIRVELKAFFGHVGFTPWAAHVMAQAWVRTLQDTLGIRDDVLITLQGKPFLLYGEIDTGTPLQRDDKVPVTRYPGLDSPFDGAVVPATFVLLGSAIGSEARPARIEVARLDTGVLVVDDGITSSGEKPQSVDFSKVVTREPGRYRAAVIGFNRSGQPTTDEIGFTVVP